MNIIHTYLPKNHRILKTSDYHLGSINSYIKGIQDVITRCEKERETYLTIDGDLIEAICIDDPRFSLESLDTRFATPIHQINELIGMLTPIRKKIIAIGSGNHETKVHSYGDLIRDMLCKQLEVPYGTYTYKLYVHDIKTNELQYKMFSTHGSRAIYSSADDPIRKEANMKLQIKNHLKNKAADCAIMSMGHSHKLIVSEPTKKLYLTDEKDHIKENYTGSSYLDSFIPEDHRWYINTGSFMKLYHMGTSGYAERFGYDPVELGYAEVVYIDKKISVYKEVI